MIPVDQTHTGENDGNCLMATVASICEVSLACLPILGPEHDDGSWFDVLVETARKFGYITTYVKNEPPLRPAGIHVALGVSPRGRHHAVVMWDGVLVHDPHPSREGLTTVQAWLLFVRLV